MPKSAITLQMELQAIKENVKRLRKARVVLQKKQRIINKNKVRSIIEHGHTCASIVDGSIKNMPVVMWCGIWNGDCIGKRCICGRLRRDPHPCKFNWAYE